MKIENCKPQKSFKAMFYLCKGTFCNSPGNSRDRLRRYWWALLPCKSVLGVNKWLWGIGHREMVFILIFDS